MEHRDIGWIKMAVTKVHDTKADGETAHCNNPETGNSLKLDAALTPSDTTQQGNRTCRSVAVALNAKGQSMDLHPLFCRSGTAACSSVNSRGWLSLAVVAPG